MTELPKRVRSWCDARWTPDEDALLKSRYLASRTITDLARLHGREVFAIQNRLKALGLAKHPAKPGL